MATPIELHAPARLSDAILTPRGPVFPSPIHWRDQVLYFLLPDRFSDGQEGSRPPYDRDHPDQFKVPVADQPAWRAAGGKWQGGTLKGIQSQLGYLQGLGVTALWIGPVFRQRREAEYDYHGYAIQNFLEVDPHFGTRQDLRDLVDAAHARGMYVLLDVIYNHIGDTFYYDDNGAKKSEMPYRFAPPYPVHGWRSRYGDSIQAPLGPDDGQWPQEFQDLGFYHRAGKIERWDPEPWEDPIHDDCPWRRGDFGAMKDIDHRVNQAMNALIDVYKYWIALSDCDGFRIDTVKHVTKEASRNFCGGILEYAESIGKENFLLLGEVTGGASMAVNYLEIFGRNLAAVLDIGDAAKHLTQMVKGLENPAEYFDQFGGHDDLGSHRALGRYHISILDDHDCVGRGKKRFSAGNHIDARYEQVAHAVGTQLTSLGTPCIYYGTEQAFDGDGTYDDNDRFIREAMFGGTFGAFVTAGCHFFDPAHPTYLRIQAIARVRNAQTPSGRALRRGRQYRRQTSTPTRDYAYPGPGEISAWSRVLVDHEVVCALNTNGTAPQEAWITVDASLHGEGDKLAVLYRSNWSDAELRNPPHEESEPITRHHDGRLELHVALPPAGMAILA